MQGKTLSPARRQIGNNKSDLPSHLSSIYCIFLNSPSLTSDLVTLFREQAFSLGFQSTDLHAVLASHAALQARLVRTFLSMATLWPGSAFPLTGLFHLQSLVSLASLPEKVNDEGITIQGYNR